MSKAIDAPTGCTLSALVEALSQADAFLDQPPEGVAVRFAPDVFVATDAMAFLCAWGLLQKARRQALRIVGPGGAVDYLARMDLFRHLEIPFEEKGRRHVEAGRFIPLRLIDDDRSLGETVDAICDLAIHQLENGREFVPALEWCANEIAGNILDHSATPVPSTVCAQYFPERQRLDIGICDMGVGLKATVSRAFPVWSHGDAITKAFERGFTRSREVGAGNGLAGSVEIIKLNEGGFNIWAGNAVYRIKDGAPAGFKLFPADIPGTGVGFRFDTSRPVDPGLTFLGRSDWTYLGSECQRVSERGGLRVAEECVHYGTRQPARALRLKVENLLPDMDGPLVLDFDGVERAASSFLDELLGRLAERLGADQFRERIKVSGAPQALLDMANMVIDGRRGVARTDSDQD